MFQRLIALCAATFFLAACETASQTDTATSGDSSASSTTASSSANSSTGTAGSAESAEAKAKAALAEVGNTVYFDFDSSALSASGTAMLGRQAAFLKANPSITVTIEGHADERGTREYNLALGDRRASAARDYLIAQGINAARVRTVSYGKERPAMAGSNNAAWAKNRRAATVIN
ncbi:peptidoglycan-associated lipoprotein Pal [Alphaproteobacteria bacterium]|nr:peptidoglycan-associated lipoprotein Pal [Alphaproteobacteria bacterium]